jgi:carboxymethylenebutenolidase
MSSSSSRITLVVGDGSEMSAYVSSPANPGPHPAILVLQEALGVNSQIRRLADRYASRGFVAIAPDLFHRVSPGYDADVLVLDEVMPFIKSLTTDGLIADLSAAHEWLASQPDVDAVKVASVGFCMGGRASYLGNSALPLAAAISYYGGSIAPGLLDRAVTMHGPHLFFWGGKDKGIPPEQHRAVADALHAADKPFVDVVYSECNHGFFNEDWAERYNESAASQSWTMGLAFLEDAMKLTLPE